MWTKPAPVFSTVAVARRDAGQDDAVVVAGEGERSIVHRDRSIIDRRPWISEIGRRHSSPD
jgi:hypothetical protein